jgi:hypothetical protein
MRKLTNSQLAKIHMGVPRITNTVKKDGNCPHCWAGNLHNGKCSNCRKGNLKPRTREQIHKGMN